MIFFVFSFFPQDLQPEEEKRRKLGNIRAITLEDLLRGLDDTRASVSKEELEKYSKM